MKSRPRQDLAVVDEEQTLTRGWRHLADLPVFEEEAVVGVMLSRRREPVPRLGVGDRPALRLLGRLEPLHVDADAHHRRVAGVSVENEVDQLLHRRVARLHLQPHPEAVAIEEIEGGLVLIRF